MVRRFVMLALGALLFAACAPVAAPTPEPTPSGGPVTITLTRSVCFGFCPDYTVSINQDGLVTYEGRRFVNVSGPQTSQIEPADVQALLARFDAINFNSLQDEYRAHVSDMPTYTVTLVRNGRSKTVVDYGGPGAGMPEAVRELQTEIDRVANTQQWVLRMGEPVREATPR
jgi:hypothetical protein